MEILLYNVFSGIMEECRILFYNQRHQIISFITFLPVRERLFYLIYYLKIEELRLKSIHNHIENIKSFPDNEESPLFKIDGWSKAQKENSNFIHFLEQQIEIISFIIPEEFEKIQMQSNKFFSKSNYELGKVLVKSTLGYIGNDKFYLNSSIKIRNFVNLIVFLNIENRLPKRYLNEELKSIIIENFVYKGTKFQIDTIKKYLNDVPKNLKNNLGELGDEYFIELILNFLQNNIEKDK